MRRALRIPTIVLIVCMLCNVLTTVGGAALSETQAAQKGAEVFEAWNIINYTEYSYMVNDYVSPNHMFVENLRTEHDWDTLLTAWRIATFDGGSEVSRITKEASYYEAFLFNVLYDEGTKSLGTSFVSSLQSSAGDIEKRWKSISASTWEKLCVQNNKYKGNPDLKDDIIIESFSEDLASIQDIKDSMKFIGTIADLMGYCSTALEFVEKISKIEALLQNTEETAVILSEMQAKAGNNQLLKTALTHFHDMLTGMLTRAGIVALFAGETAIEQMAEKAASKLWDAIVDSSPYILIAAGQKIGKFTTDTLFNTSNTITGYYKLQAMNSFEDLIKAVTLDCQAVFLSNPNPQTAKKFIAAFKLLFKTYLEGLDCADEFLKAANEEGWYNKIVNALSEKTQYKSVQQSIKNLKNSISSTLDYIDTSSYNFYLDVLSTMPSGVAIPSVTPLPLVEIQPEVELEAIKEESFKLRNPVFSKNTTLDSDLETYGNVSITGGTLDLNGHKMTVYGDFLHGNGTIKINKGTLEIEGNYRIQSISTDVDGEESYVASRGSLTMQYKEDLLKVHGKWICQSEKWSDHLNLSGGRMELFGGLEDIARFSTGGTHVTAFVGDKEQRVVIKSGSSIQNLEIAENAKVIWNGALNVSAITQDESITSDDLRIQNLNLNGKTLTVQGDVLHDSGRITLNKGTLDINGDFRIQSISTNIDGEESYVASRGSLTVQYKEDLLRVHGKWICQSEKWSDHLNLSGGRMELFGGLEDIARFSTGGTHVTAFVGDKEQRVVIKSGSSIQNLEIAKNAKVIWNGALNVSAITQDESITSDDLRIQNLNLDGKTLTVQGDVLHDSGRILLNKGMLDINGDLRIQAISTNIDGEESYVQSNGYLVMQYKEDVLKVRGKWICQSADSSRLTLSGGRLELYGGLEDIARFSTSGTHVTAFVGNGEHIVSLMNSSQILNMELAPGTKVQWNGAFGPTESSDANIAEVSNHTITGENPGKTEVTIADSTGRKIYSSNVIVPGDDNSLCGLYGMTFRDDTKVTVNFSFNSQDSAVMLIVAYTQNHQFLRATSLDLKDSKIERQSLDVELDTSDAAYVSVFMFNSNRQPLCEKMSKEIASNPEATEDDATS